MRKKWFPWGEVAFEPTYLDATARKEVAEGIFMHREGESFVATSDLHPGFRGVGASEGDAYENLMTHIEDHFEISASDANGVLNGVELGSGFVPSVAPLEEAGEPAVAIDVPAVASELEKFSKVDWPRGIDISKMGERVDLQAQARDSELSVEDLLDVLIFRAWKVKEGKCSEDKLLATRLKIEERVARLSRERDDARADLKWAGEGYAGNPCPNCGRIRVYLRKDGREKCEKCEMIFPGSHTQEDDRP